MNLLKENFDCTWRSAFGKSFAAVANVSLTNLWDTSPVSTFTRQTLTEVVPTSMPKTKRPFILFLLDWPFGGDSLFGDCDAMLCVSGKKDIGSVLHIKEEKLNAD